MNLYSTIAGDFLARIFSGDFVYMPAADSRTSAFLDIGLLY